MATRINVMKLLQEVRGFAELTNRRPQNRLPGPLLLQANWSGSRRPGPHKRIVRIHMDNPPDIPHPVKIHYIPISEPARVTPRERV